MTYGIDSTDTPLHAATACDPQGISADGGIIPLAHERSKSGGSLLGPRRFGPDSRLLDGVVTAAMAPAEEPEEVS
jgi:hypothetical protein